MRPGDVYWQPEKRGIRTGPWVILLIVVAMWLVMMPYTKPPAEPSVEMASSSIVQQPEKKAVPIATSEPVHILNPSSAEPKPVPVPLRSTTSSEPAEARAARHAASDYRQLREQLLGPR